jgi:hypothetical protein
MIPHPKINAFPVFHDAISAQQSTLVNQINVFQDTHQVLESHRHAVLAILKMDTVKI